MLLLTLPGAAFVYQGDEIGTLDGADEGVDRAGRDRFRHPMQWEPTPSGGFTTGTPWLTLSDPESRSVAAQREDPASLLSLYRRLIELRRLLGGPFEMLEATPGMLAFRRGEHAVAVNFGPDPAPSPVSGEVLLATDGRRARTDREPIAASAGIVVHLGS